MVNTVVWHGSDARTMAATKHGRDMSDENAAHETRNKQHN